MSDGEVLVRGNPGRETETHQERREAVQTEPDGTLEGSEEAESTGSYESPWVTLLKQQQRNYNPPLDELPIFSAKDMVGQHWDDFDAAASEIASLLRRKQRDYGPKGIVAAGHHGIAVRVIDKAYRLLNLTDSDRESENESVRDTYMDLAGYGIIGMMLMDGIFPPRDVYSEDD